MEPTKLQRFVQAVDRPHHRVLATLLVLAFILSSILPPLVVAPTPAAADTVVVKSATLPYGRWDPSCATASNNKIYCFGGLSAGGSAYNQIVEYNPATDTLVTKTAVLPTARANMNCVGASNGKIYCFGGWGGSYLNQIVEYNPTTDTIATKSAQLPTARGYVRCAEYPGNSKIYCFGGTNGPTNYNQILEYNPATDALAVKSAVLPSARFGAACAYTAATGKIYCVSGSTGSAVMTTQVVEYNPATDAITVKTAQLPIGTNVLSCKTNVATGKIICFGAPSTATPPGLYEIDSYDAAADTMTQVATIPSPNRTSLDCGYASTNGKIYCFGGAAMVSPWVLTEIFEYTSSPAATTPGAPTSLDAVAGNGKISLSWVAPSSNGGSAITGYGIYRGTASPASTFLATTGTTPSYNDFTAATGTTYYYRVTAVNAIGTSTYSNEDSAVIANAPTCSISFNPTFINQGGSATLTWSSTNATSGSIDNGVGSVSPVAGGTRSVSPIASTPYTGTFNGPGGQVQCQTILTVNPPAGSTGNVTGWLWSGGGTGGTAEASGGVGWISLNCYDLGTCGTSTYGMNIDTEGIWSGYAWSENVGWVSANASDLSGCPASPCRAYMEGSDLKGWMKALGSNSSEAGGWDGWISLSGSSPTYGPTLSAGKFLGWAWGGDRNLGWIGFDSYSGYEAKTTFDPCTPSYQCLDETHYDNLCTTSIQENIQCQGDLICSEAGGPPCVTPPAPFTPSGDELSVAPRLVRQGNTTNVFWDVSYADECTVTTPSGVSWNGISSETADCSNHNGTSCISPPIQQQTTFTLQCEGPGGTFTQQATVYLSPLWKEI